MAVNEVNTLIHTKDSEGNTTIHYPITKSDNVILSEALATALNFTDEATLEDAFFADAIMCKWGQLTAGSDIDGILAGGCYQCAGVEGLPTNGYGVLLVISGGGYYVQRYTCVAAAGNYTTWQRTTDENGWSDWVQIYDSRSVIPVANGGTGATNASDALESLGAEVKDGYGFLDEGTDIRTLSGKNGWYMLAIDRNYVNVPAGSVGFWCVLEVKDKTATLKIINGGMYYCSNIAVAEHDSWEKIVYASELATLTGTVPATVEA